jgi:hypothetical protein
MKTLKKLSEMYPGSYKVIDSIVIQGKLKDWSDKIEIIFDGKSKFVTRKGAYKYGLCEKP